MTNFFNSKSESYREIARQQHALLQFLEMIAEVYVTACRTDRHHDHARCPEPFGSEFHGEYYADHADFPSSWRNNFNCDTVYSPAA